MPQGKAMLEAKKQELKPVPEFDNDPHDNSVSPGDARPPVPLEMIAMNVALLGVGSMSALAGFNELTPLMQTMHPQNATGDGGGCSSGCGSGCGGCGGCGG